MTSTTSWQNHIVPAQLSYIAIFSPPLGPTEETFDQQLVFYYSRQYAEAKAAQRKNGKSQDTLPDQSNQQLRQIGLAQGLVDFARTFSNGKPVDSVDTEKSRTIIIQLEDGWWLLASIDLTRISLANNDTSSFKPVKTHTKQSTTNTPRFEYSAREVSPPSLLTEQIKQAHSIFTLHHGPSLAKLHTRLSRDRFCNTLERFWTRFAKSWHVLLHGNPAVEALGGVKLASGGELGFGVGEELWGSGERDVLEDITRQTEGLIDTVVARFGDPAAEETTTPASTGPLPWIGAGDYPSVTDGIIFGGTNAVTRASLRSISLWMRHIYTYGEYAYGVRDNPSRERRRKRRRNGTEQINTAGDGPNTPQEVHSMQRKRSSSKSIQQRQPREDPVDLAFLPKDTRPQLHDRIASQDHASSHTTSQPGIPPPIVSAAEAALNAATRKAEQTTAETKVDATDDGTTLGIPDQYLKYLTLGLSTFAKPAATVPLSRASTSTSSSKTLVHDKQKEIAKHDDLPPMQDMSLLEPIPDGDAAKAKVAHQRYQEGKGHFIIGLKGDLDAIPEDDAEVELTEGSLYNDTGGNRTILRTIYVHIQQQAATNDEDSDETVGVAPDAKLTRIRVVIYAHRPFLYCFLFEPRTSSLSYASFYRTIRRNLMPIHKPLLSSTQPNKVAERINNANTTSGAAYAYASSNPNNEEVFNLLYDPLRLTVHATVPNIPEPGSLAAEGILISHHKRHTTNWSRLDALNVHSAIINTLNATHRRKQDLERCSRTSKNWWVLWMRLPASDKFLDSNISEDASTDARRQFLDRQGRIAVVIRKAVDGQTSHNSSAGSRAASGMWSSLALMSRSEGAPPGDAGLSSAGIGFDARKYIEGLLSLNR